MKPCSQKEKYEYAGFILTAQDCILKAVAIRELKVLAFLTEIHFSFAVPYGR